MHGREEWPPGNRPEEPEEEHGVAGRHWPPHAQQDDAAQPEDAEQPDYEESPWGASASGWPPGDQPDDEDAEDAEDAYTAWGFQRPFTPPPPPYAEPAPGAPQEGAPGAPQEAAPGPVAPGHTAQPPQGPPPGPPPPPPQPPPVAPEGYPSQVPRGYGQPSPPPDVPDAPPPPGPAPYGQPYGEAPPPTPPGPPPAEHPSAPVEPPAAEVPPPEAPAAGSPATPDAAAPFTQQSSFTGEFFAQAPGSAGEEAAPAGETWEEAAEPPEPEPPLEYVPPEAAEPQASQMESATPEPPMPHQAEDARSEVEADAESTAPQPVVDPDAFEQPDSAARAPDEPPVSAAHEPVSGESEEPPGPFHDDETLTFPRIPAAEEEEAPAAASFRETTYADQPPHPGAQQRFEAPPEPPAGTAPYGQPPGQYGQYGQPAVPYGDARGYAADVRDTREVPPGGGYPGGGDIVASEYDYEEYEPPAKRRGSKSLLLLACAVVAVIALTGGGVAGYQIIAQPQGSTTGTDPSPGTANTGGQSAQPTPSQNPAKLNSASTDPKPMTLREAFPGGSVQVGGRTYDKVAQNITEACAEAGRAEFAPLLEEAGCTRVLRATYVDSTQTYAVTAGIIVLPSKADAADVREGTTPQQGVFPKALGGSPGAERIETSSGFGAFTYVGRYFVFSFAAFSDGHDSANEQEKEALSAESVAFRKYATKPLFQRMYETN